MNANRITRLKQGSENPNKKYVLYWMQQSQRVFYNHALNHAIEIANQINLPLKVFFGLTPNYPDANQRHYLFMLEGLRETRKLLIENGINFIFKLESPEKAIIEYLEDADTLVMDYGYLKHQRMWRHKVWDYANRYLSDLCIDIVDSDVIVPVDVVSNKAEYGAYTLRPKLHKLYGEYRDYFGLKKLKITMPTQYESDDDLSDPMGLIKRLDIDKSVLPSRIYHGGYSEAKKHLEYFISVNINQYPSSNDPGYDRTSKLSLYLHFGQISVLEILEHIINLLHSNQITQEAYLAFFEQLLVRRELAYNYVTYQQGYDRFETMTESWALQTMREHDNDPRIYNYSIEEIELGKTHDRYFNAAMKEMVHTGYMHNYMRMYWAKKIIEWTPSFKSAYNLIIKLNNRYFIDGRDANSYAGVAWCFGKHDRAWTERPIFGKLRYMNDKGLERKFEMNKYIERIDNMTKN